MFSGPNRLVRSAEERAKGSTYRRPITKICLLEESDSGEAQWPESLWDKNDWLNLPFNMLLPFAEHFLIKHFWLTKNLPFNMLLPFVEHFYSKKKKKKKGISCSSVGRPVPPIRQCPYCRFPRACTYSNHITDLNRFGA